MISVLGGRELIGLLPMYEQMSVTGRRIRKLIDSTSRRNSAMLQLRKLWPYIGSLPEISLSLFICESPNHHKLVSSKRRMKTAAIATSGADAGQAKVIDDELAQAINQISLVSVSFQYISGKLSNSMLVYAVLDSVSPTSRHYCVFYFAQIQILEFKITKPYRNNNNKHCPR